MDRSLTVNCLVEGSIAVTSCLVKTSMLFFVFNISGVKDLSTNEETKTDYDKLIISSGARPDYPDIPGVFEAENGFVLRSVTDDP